MERDKVGDIFQTKETVEEGGGDRRRDGGGGGGGGGSNNGIISADLFLPDFFLGCVWGGGGETCVLLMLYLRVKLHYCSFKTGVSGTEGFLCTVVAGPAV